MQYDVIIIGAGASGCAVARELSRYRLRTVVLEKEEDVCSGTSKANSGIVHAGFDAEPGSLKAKLNLEGSQMMAELSRTLDFPFKQNGSLVLCFDQQEVSKLEELKAKGVSNGVKDLRIVDAAELKAIEPNVSPQAVAALYAPTGGIVCPFGMTIALAENAFANGVEFRMETGVQRIEALGDGQGYRIITNKGDFLAKVVVNAAGVYADVIHNMVSSHKLSITPRRGQYFLLDKKAGALAVHTLFQLPGALGKGVLVTPTVHGNLILGPTAEDVETRDVAAVTAEGLSAIRDRASLSIENIPFHMVITSFAGLRAHESGHDFIIGEAKDAKGFIDVAGIESPGLTSAPAIGRMVSEMAAAMLVAEERKDFIKERNGIVNLAELSIEDRNKRIKENPLYGTIICRCEMVSEGEIVDAIRRPLGAVSLDGVKRRTRAGMGRCQAGFCTPRTMEILERELGTDMLQICKNRSGSQILTGKPGEWEEEAASGSANSDERRGEGHEIS